MKLTRPSFVLVAALVAVAALVGLAAHLQQSFGWLAGLGLVLGVNALAGQFTGAFSGTLGLNALDIAKLNAGDEMSALIEKNKNAAPELALFPAFEIAGTSATTCIRTGYPAGAFKKLGGGVTPGGSSFDNVQFSLYNYDNPLQERDDIMKSHRKGRDFALALALSGAVKGAFELMGKAVYYGARSFGGGVDAFPGLIDLYDSTTKFVDAGGTTASTGSSVWFIKFGDQEDGLVSMIFGNGRGLSARDWLLQQLVIDSATGTVADGWTNSLNAAVGVQLADVDAAVRIGKLTEDSGKGLTDTLGYKALEKFPVGMKPDVALMTRRSQRQLRDSRTGTGGGAPNIALPTDIAGIPIVLTDSILNTEALAL